MGRSETLTWSSGFNSTDFAYLPAMEDFSSLAEPTTEWLKWVESHGIPTPTPVGRTSPEELQKLTNEGREIVSAEAMRIEGSRKC